MPKTNQDFFCHVRILMLAKLCFPYKYYSRKKQSRPAERLLKDQFLGHGEESLFLTRTTRFSLVTIIIYQQLSKFGVLCLVTDLKMFWVENEPQDEQDPPPWNVDPQFIQRLLCPKDASNCLISLKSIKLCITAPYIVIKLFFTVSNLNTT